MEVNPAAPPKGLSKHALPIVMVLVALLACSVVAVSDRPSPAAALARGLTTQVVHLKSSPNGLVKISLSPAATPAGAVLQGLPPAR